MAQIENKQPDGRFKPNHINTVTILNQNGINPSIKAKTIKTR